MRRFQEIRRQGHNAWKEFRNNGKDEGMKWDADKNALERHNALNKVENSVKQQKKWNEDSFVMPKQKLSEDVKNGFNSLQGKDRGRELIDTFRDPSAVVAKILEIHRDKVLRKNDENVGQKEKNLTTLINDLNKIKEKKERPFDLESHLSPEGKQALQGAGKGVKGLFGDPFSAAERLASNMAGSVEYPTLTEQEEQALGKGLVQQLELAELARQKTILQKRLVEFQNETQPVRTIDRTNRREVGIKEKVEQEEKKLNDRISKRTERERKILVDIFGNKAEATHNNYMEKIKAQKERVETIYNDISKNYAWLDNKAIKSTEESEEEKDMRNNLQVLLKEKLKGGIGVQQENQINTMQGQLNRSFERRKKRESINSYKSTFDETYVKIKNLHNGNDLAQESYIKSLESINHQFKEMRENWSN